MRFAASARLLVLALFLPACGAPDSGDNLGHLNQAAGGDAVRVATLNPAGTLRITMYDVGNADGLVIRFPNDRVMVLDGGKSNTRFNNYLRGVNPNTGEPGLANRGDVSWVFLSHAHQDHFQGLRSAIELLANPCNPCVFHQGYVPTMPDFYYNDRFLTPSMGMRHTLVAGEDPAKLVPAGTMWDPDVAVDVLSPGMAPMFTDPAGGHELNNNSLVMRLRYKQFSILFMGDAELAAEANLKRPLKSTILKVGHHGSDTSTGPAFLADVDPQLALVSTRPNMRYSHPKCAVLGRLPAFVRTDRVGAVTVISNGTEWTYVTEKVRPLGMVNEHDMANCF